MKIDYIGEHLFPGQLGHLLVILAFVSSILATVAYAISAFAKTEPERASWRRLGRGAFMVQFVSFFSIFFTLAWVIFHHYFEYQYVWEYTKRDQATGYLWASIWNGQEGSFLLWSLWNCVLGGAIILTTRKSNHLQGGWEGPVMTVMSFAQIALASMLLGIYMFGLKLGSNPFILFRQANPEMPVFQNPNYLSLIADGRGLNPLLQNYWVIIHPPILFCGYASTIVPFAFAIAGLWTKRYKEWIRPALPWALFSGMVLGTGVMMGAMWAYETLSFGGFWAWDPVENASLVPWLLLIGGIHTLVVFKNTGHSLKITFFLFIMSFVLVLYATYLTRSGILGDTSVHAFTGEGLGAQLLIFLFMFFIGALVLFFAHYKHLPEVKREEGVDSREFWMYIGSLLLLLSGLFIIISTSIPVWNKLFNTHIAPAVDQKFHYNKVQVFAAILIGLGTGLIQFFKYRKTASRLIWKKVWKPMIIALIVGGLICFFGNLKYWDHGIGFLIALNILIVTSAYAVVSNLAYIITEQKGKLKNAGASIAHVGFGLMLIGIVIASSKRTAISHDSMGLIGNNYFPEGSEEAKHPEENVYLPRNIPMAMGDYEVTYLGDSTAPKDPKTYYKVNYIHKNKKGEKIDEFTMYPDAFVNPQGEEGLIANPDSKHYWDRDMFTYVTSVFDQSKMEDTAKYKSYEIAPGDSIFFSDGYLLLQKIVTDARSANYHPQPGDLAVGAQLSIFDGHGRTYSAMPIYYIRDSSYQFSVPDTVNNLALYIRFDKILPDVKKIKLDIKQSGIVNDYIVMKAYVFPFINVLWVGTLIMIFGFFMSIRSGIVRIAAQKAGKSFPSPKEPELKVEGGELI